MTPHAFVKRQRSASVESAASSTSNKRTGSSSSSATTHLAAMDLNASSDSSATSSSASTEPLAMDDEASTDARTAKSPRQTPPAPNEQLNIVVAAAKQPMQAGDNWFLIDRRWYRRWQAACGDPEAGKEAMDSASLGPIDNSSFADPMTGAITKAPVEGQDVEYLPTDAWFFLEAWYGCAGKPVQRQVIQAPDGPVLDLFPPLLTVHHIIPANSPIMPKPALTLQASSGWTVKHLKSEMARLYQLEPSATSRIWHLSGPHEQASIAADRLGSAELEAAQDDDIVRISGIRDGQNVALEQANEDGTWPSPSAPDSGVITTPAGGLFSGPSFLDQKESQHQAARKTAALASQSSAFAASTSSKPLAASDMRVTRSQTGANSGRRGLVGLGNLGNTCFMNSALQCLSNTPSLQHYFHSGFYKTELNPDNPLGMHGEVAMAFGALIEQLWNGTSSSYSPRQFKQTLARFAPAFSGWQQHDSQELIAFLLDGLHEDLNRIKKKPYDDIPDWNGGGDKEEMELANISWDLYKRRNDSVIVDLFQGQYRSRLVCPECGKVAIKFDPFMYLSLAIPQYRTWTSDVFLTPADPKRPRIKVTVELSYNATFKMVKEKVGDLTGYDPHKLFLLEEFSHKYFKAWSDNDSVSQLTKTDIITLSEVPFVIAQPRYRPSNSKTFEEEGKFFVTVLSVRAAGSAGLGSRNDRPFGEPFILSFTEDEVCDVEAIEQRVAERLEAWSAVGNKIWATSIANGEAEGSSTVTNGIAAPTSKPSSSSSRIVVDDEDDIMDTDAPAIVPAALRKLPNPNLITITVARQTAPTAQLFVSDPPHDRITLTERYNQVHAMHDAQDRRLKNTSIPGAFQTDADGDDLYAEDNEKANSTQRNDVPAVASPVSTRTQLPILHSGEILAVEWHPRFAMDCFGGDIDAKAMDTTSFSVTERIIDPVILRKRKAGNTDGKLPVTSVEDLLDEFVKEEKLSEDNMWYCPECKKHQQAQKKFDLWKMPDVLVIHLKRFSNERAFRDKIDTFIDFPIDGLNISERVEGRKVAERLKMTDSLQTLSATVDTDESLIYDLYAVDNHFGGLGGGHYTAFAKNIQDSKWYNFDDSRVSPVSRPDDVKTSAAYLLFYRRRTDKPIGGKTHEILSSRAASPMPSVSALGESTGEQSFRTDGAGSSSKYFEQQSEHASGSGIRQFGRLSHSGYASPELGDDTDVDVYSSAPLSRNDPSPQVSDDEDEGTAGMRDYPRDSVTNFGGQFRPGGFIRPSVSTGWAFGTQSRDDDLPDYTNVMDISVPASPVQSAPIEIKIDPSEMARAAQAVVESTPAEPSSMDDVE